MRTHDDTLRDAAVFLLLIAIGVAGRWAQPEWCFTPIAATTIAAGYVFARWQIAVLVPLAILGISDLILPTYDNLVVMLVTYIVMMLPVWLGQSLRDASSGKAALARGLLCGLLPATLFFVATNFAVWAFQSEYPLTWAGLMQCYVAAVPFFRWMLAGDLFYLSVLAVCFVVAGYRVREPFPALNPV